MLAPSLSGGAGGAAELLLQPGQMVTVWVPRGGWGVLMLPRTVMVVYWDRESVEMTVLLAVEGRGTEVSTAGGGDETDAGMVVPVVSVGMAIVLLLGSEVGGSGEDGTSEVDGLASGVMDAASAGVELVIGAASVGMGTAGEEEEEGRGGDRDDDPDDGRISVELSTTEGLTTVGLGGELEVAIILPKVLLSISVDTC